MAILDPPPHTPKAFRGDFLRDLHTPSSHQLSPADQEKMRSEYSFVREIGRGYYGVVRECKDRSTGEIFACKTMKKERIRCKETVLREIDVMRRLSTHENVVGIKKVIEDSRHVHIIMDYCAGGDLCDEINRRARFSEREAARIFYQIANAVAFCHSKGVMHRDLKPENILLTRKSSASLDPKSYGSAGEPDEEDEAPSNSASNSLERNSEGEFVSGDPFVMLADFGQAVYLKLGDVTNGICGSIYYLAPELVLGDKYGHAADVWSMGIILYCLLSGNLPFQNSDKKSIHQEICRGKFDLSTHHWSSVSSDAKHLVGRMLVVDPKLRISAADILNHPWVVKHRPQSSASNSRCHPKTPAYSTCSLPKLSLNAAPYIPSHHSTASAPYTHRLSAPPAQYCTSSSNCSSPTLIPNLGALLPPPSAKSPPPPEGPNLTDSTRWSATRRVSDAGDEKLSVVSVPKSLNAAHATEGGKPTQSYSPFPRMPNTAAFENAGPTIGRFAASSVHKSFYGKELHTNEVHSMSRLQVA